MADERVRLTRLGECVDPMAHAPDDPIERLDRGNIAQSVNVVALATDLPFQRTQRQHGPPHAVNKQDVHILWPPH